jgi:two-component system NtrC family sensor kinase
MNNQLIKDSGVEKNGKSKVLFVDDDEQIRRLMADVLLNYGFIPHTAINGMEALQKTKELRPDIIILDIFLPDINGIDVCKRLRENQDSQAIPIIMITGFGDKEIKIKCLNAGANDFLTKPIDYAELLARTRNLIELAKFKDIHLENKVLIKTIDVFKAAKKEWEVTMDCINDIIILIDARHNIIRCNKILCTLSGKPYSGLIDKKWMDVLNECGFSINEKDKDISELPHSSGKWYMYNSYPIEISFKYPYSVVITLHDITESKIAEDGIKQKNTELQKAYAELKVAQSRILQQDKMASIGQLAAGVAHEINNPMGYIISNLTTLDKYVNKMKEFICEQNKVINELTAGKSVPSLSEKRNKIKLDYILDDANQLLRESLDGSDKIKTIVQGLKEFSHIDESAYKMADINSGIESTIKVLWNEFKYKVTLKKEYGDIPVTRCNLQQLNQVFMNILMNAAYAIETRGEIRVKTWSDGIYIYISISDTGSGIPEDKINRVFEPFFTTKEVGKGTGLGLSIAYDIVKKHNGDIKVESAERKGTTFTIMIPLAGK